MNVFKVEVLLNAFFSPDRYVILGGHRDSWVFEGIDPISGAATLQEVAQSFGKLLSSGK